MYPVPCRCSQRLLSPQPGIGQEEPTLTPGQAQVLIAAQQALPVREPSTAPSPEAQAEEMEKVIMKEAITSAAVNAGLQISLSVMPVVGQALAAVVGIVNLVGGKRYERKLKEHMEAKQRELQKFVADKQKELDNALSSSYKAAYQTAVRLALSDESLEIIEHKVQSVLNPAMVPIDGLGIIDRITGRSTYSKGRDQMNAVVAQHKKILNDEFNPVIRKVKEPGFRALLGKQIAISIRGSPEFEALAKQYGIPAASTYSREVTKPGSPAYDPQIAQTAAPGMGVPNLTPVFLTGAAVLGAILLIR